MAQVTVEQLAKTVGASVDRLLSQMKDAGLPHKAADEVVSEVDKQTLLAHLKRSHGESADAPKKITLKRKKVSTLRTGSSSGGNASRRRSKSKSKRVRRAKSSKSRKHASGRKTGKSGSRKKEKQPEDSNSQSKTSGKENISNETYHFE